MDTPSETEVEDFQQYDIAYGVPAELGLEVQVAAAEPELVVSTEGLLFDEIRPVEPAIIDTDYQPHESPTCLSDKNLLAFDVEDERDETVAQSPTLARSQSNDGDDELYHALPATADVGHTRAPVFVRFV